MKRYYSTHRPVGPGTYPRAEAHEIHNYEDRQYVRDAGREVWGYIEYDRELTPEETRSYELVEGGKEEDVRMLGKISGIEAALFYEKERRLELRKVWAYLHEAVEEFADATGVTLDGTEEPERPSIISGLVLIDVWNPKALVVSPVKVSTRCRTKKLRYINELHTIIPAEEGE